MDIRKAARKRMKKMMLFVLGFMGLCVICGFPIMAQNPAMGIFIEIVGIPGTIFALVCMIGRAPVEKKIDMFLSNFGDPEEIYRYVNKLPNFPLKQKQCILRFDENWFCALTDTGVLMIVPTNTIEKISVTKINGTKEYFALILIRNPYGKPIDPKAGFWNTFEMPQIEIRMGKGKEESMRILDALSIAVKQSENGAQPVPEIN